ncbi:plasmid partition protein ParG [Nostoc sphaeroides]|uniref:Arc-type ribbon-helix-helix (Plasmid) n=1 Tax=Nostoc sphaeroides CCNUC1 TaxID=2653204 RepID=A0A5P8WCG9_9NOSO|nr:plasmid partition protein ParG [Nostoc sphaeroides]QFS49619.1 Arc-type ribbon-helix-helix [Nostoc sphaeroides CCNUC1]
MQISITDDLKKRFHAACALRGLKMSHVVVEMIEQWLTANEVQLSSQVSSVKH